MRNATAVLAPERTIRSRLESFDQRRDVEHTPTEKLLVGLPRDITRADQWPDFGTDVAHGNDVWGPMCSLGTNSCRSLPISAGSLAPAGVPLSRRWESPRAPSRIAVCLRQSATELEHRALRWHPARRRHRRQHAAQLRHPPGPDRRLWSPRLRQLGRNKGICPPSRFLVILPPTLGSQPWLVSGRHTPTRPPRRNPHAPLKLLSSHCHMAHKGVLTRA